MGQDSEQRGEQHGGGEHSRGCYGSREGKNKRASLSMELAVSLNKAWAEKLRMLNEQVQVKTALDVEREKQCVRKSSGSGGDDSEREGKKLLGRARDNVSLGMLFKLT